MTIPYKCDWCGEIFDGGPELENVLCPMCLKEYLAEQHRIFQRRKRREKKKQKSEITISDILRMAERALKERENR